MIFNHITTSLEIQLLAVFKPPDTKILIYCTDLIFLHICIWTGCKKLKPAAEPHTA